MILRLIIENGVPHAIVLALLRFGRIEHAANRITTALAEILGYYVAISHVHTVVFAMHMLLQSPITRNLVLTGLIGHD